MTVLVRARDLSGGYGGAPAIDGLDFTLRAGERVGLLGPNGGGKTTLFRAVLGELPVVRGGLAVATRCAVVPQTERSRLDFPVSALDVALMGTLARLPWWRRPGRADRRAACEALERVGLGAEARRTFGELSGGQRQRVLIARALVQDAGLLLLDEPFTGLDEPSSRRLEGLLAELAADGRGLLISTHEVDQARAWDLVLCLNRAQIAFGAPDEVLTRPVLERTYGAQVVELPGGGRGVMPAHHHDHDHEPDRA
ncbi:metal ABC transporter ATP-binding protein [Capillimicrobium parvum]|uniref:Manganese transport system ATP-binding protein MntB n=1 Tax=Capillimicrobium parvum TaxID=2884022 RepID=A0A9E6Y1L6_9ACTN|nr:metal ABC transporter ATP-binding protein [Capillimicrobium parvum]UGS38454.1 Manganese transport system ATP-binding protein MntB [Capillimicrobium parvum]